MHSRSPKGLAELQKQRLFECIATGRLYKLRLMLEDDECEVDVNCFDENQLTPLMLACSLEDEKYKTRDHIIRILLKRGANPNITDPKGMTVLANACQIENIQMVRTLLNRASLDIDFNTKDQKGDTPLMHAVRTGNTHVVRLLVNIMNRLSIDIDVRNNNDITPYLEAKRLGLEDVADMLRNIGHASTSLQIFPLVFDECNEQLDLQAKTSRQGLIIPIEPDSHKVQPAWKSRRAASRNRAAKFTFEPKKDIQKVKKTIVSKSPIEADFLVDRGVTDQRERSKSVKTQEDRAVHVNIKNAESEIEKPEERGELGRSRDAAERRPSGNTDTSVKFTDLVNATNEPLNEQDKVRHQASAEKARKLQPHISVSDEKTSDHKEATAMSEDVIIKSKNIWQSRLSKKTPNWKRKLQLGDSKDVYGFSSSEEHRGDGRNAELCRESTISGGALRKLLLEKPGTPSVTRRCTSNLSVYFNDPSRMARSRPTSANNNGPELYNEFDFVPRQTIVEDASKQKITYEEIFELCPDLKETSKRTWHSDLRWMLALRAHQNCPTYLPPQPERFTFEYATSEPRIDNESRMGRRISFVELKRPSLRKRNTILSPTAMRESKELK